MSTDKTRRYASGWFGAAVFLTGAACLASAAVLSPSQKALTMVAVADKNDDWFAEIDDMIQELGVSPDVSEAPAARPPVRHETNSSSSTAAPIGRPDARRYDNRSMGRPTPGEVARVSTLLADSPSYSESVARQTSPGPAAQSIIEEILRSDYWLEDDMRPRPRTLPTPLPGPTIEQARRQEELAAAEAPARSAGAGAPVSVLPGGDDLAALESELMRELVEETQSRPKPQPTPVPVIREVTESPPVPRTTEKGGTTPNSLEEDLLSELDSFMTRTRTPPVQAVAQQESQEDETGLLLTELKEAMDRHKPARPQDLTPEVEQALVSVEQGEPAEVEMPAEGAGQTELFARIEQIQYHIDQAVQRGDRAELSKWSVELQGAVAQLGAPVEPVADRPPEVASAGRTVRPEGAQRVVMVLEEESERPLGTRTVEQPRTYVRASGEPGRVPPPGKEASLAALGGQRPNPVAFLQVRPTQESRIESSAPAAAPSSRRGVARHAEAVVPAAVPSGSDWDSPVPY